MSSALLRPTRWKIRLAAVIAGSALAVPLTASGAHAASPSPVSTVTWNLRTSWVDYLTNPVWYAGLGQGTVTNTTSNGGTSVPDASAGTTSWDEDLGYVDTDYADAFPVASGSGTGALTLEGGLTFDLSAHGIHIVLTDVRVVDNATTDGEEIVVDGSYQPLIGSAVTLTDTDAFHVSGTPDANGDYAVTLAAGGAPIFNGGSNGAYSSGEAFGSLDFS